MRNGGQRSFGRCDEEHGGDNAGRLPCLVHKGKLKSIPLESFRNERKISGQMRMQFHREGVCVRQPFRFAKEVFFVAFDIHLYEIEAWDVLFPENGLDRNIVVGILPLMGRT